MIFKNKHHTLNLNEHTTLQELYIKNIYNIDDTTLPIIN